MDRPRRSPGNATTTPSCSNKKAFFRAHGRTLSAQVGPLCLPSAHVLDLSVCRVPMCWTLTSLLSLSLLLILPGGGRPCLPPALSRLSLSPLCLSLSSSSLFHSAFSPSGLLPSGVGARVAIRVPASGDPALSAGPPCRFPFRGDAPVGIHSSRLLVHHLHRPRLDGRIGSQ